jgi:hypothetical protein
VRGAGQLFPLHILIGILPVRLVSCTPCCTAKCNQNQVKISFCRPQNRREMVAETGVNLARNIEVCSTPPGADVSSANSERGPISPLTCVRGSFRKRDPETVGLASPLSVAAAFVCRSKNLARGDLSRRPVTASGHHALVATARLHPCDN